jgi:DNA-binding CsgD family transcriptional regulator
MPDVTVTETKEVKITPRDVIWLQQLADGKEPKNLTGATTQGVRNRMYRLRHIFGANTTAQVIAMAMRKGIIL